MGFHAPQEAARILAEAIDYARQGVAAACWMIPAVAWLGFSAPRLIQPIAPGDFERAHDAAKRRVQQTAFERKWAHGRT